MSNSEKIQIEVVKFGNQRETVEVNATDTWRAVYNQIPDADNKYVCVYGDAIEEHIDEPVKADIAVFVAPKKIAQGVKLYYAFKRFFKSL